MWVACGINICNFCKFYVVFDIDGMKNLKKFPDSKSHRASIGFSAS